MNYFTDEELYGKQVTTYDYMDWFVLLMNLALTRYKFSGLPDTCNEKFLQYTLVTKGQVGFFIDEISDTLIHTEIAGGGQLTIYNEMSFYNCLTPIRTWTKSRKELGIIYANAMLRPLTGIIQKYALKLADTDSTIKINEFQQKIPYFIETDQKFEKTIKAILSMIQANNVAILAPKDSNKEDFKFDVIQTNVPYLLDKLDAHKQVILSQILAILGINTVSLEKKERVVTAEANANEEYAAKCFGSDLIYWKMGVEEVNQKFGTNITVDKNDLWKEVINNGTLDDDNTGT